MANNNNALGNGMLLQEVQNTEGADMGLRASAVPGDSGDTLMTQPTPLQLEYQRDIANIRADLIEGQSSWFEILTSSMIGLFAVLITVVVIYFAFRFGKEAVKEAKTAALEGIEEQREEISRLAEEAKVLLAQIHQDRATIRQLTEDLEPEQSPSDPQTVSAIEKVAEQALREPLRERTPDQYRALVLAALMKKEWHDMERRAVEMEILFPHDDDEENHAFALFNHAYAASQLEHHTKAIEIYEDLLLKYRLNEKQPDYIYDVIARAMANKAQAFDALGKKQDAIESYLKMRDLLSCSGDDDLAIIVAQSGVNLAACYFENGQEQLAIAAYEWVASNFGDSTELELLEAVCRALVAGSSVHMDLREYEEAEAKLFRVSALSNASEHPEILRQRARAFVNLGAISIHQDSPEKSIDFFDKAIEVCKPLENQDDVEILAKALLNESIAFGLMDELASAKLACEKLDDVPHKLRSSVFDNCRFEALLNLAQVQMRLKEGLDALETFDTISTDVGTQAELSGFYIRAMIGSGSVYANGREFDKAHECFDRADEAISDYLGNDKQVLTAECLASRASALFHSNKAYAAVELLQKLTDQAGDEKDQIQYVFPAYLNLSSKFIELERYGDALMVVNVAQSAIEKNHLELSPLHRAGLCAYKALALSHEGDLSSAIEASNVGIEILEEGEASLDISEAIISDSLSHLHYNLACIHARLGDVERAIVSLNNWADKREKFSCEQVREDEDFELIRKNPKFISYLESKDCVPM